MVGGVTDRPTDRLTLDEAAAVLGISREAVRLRIRRGTLAGERVGGIWSVTLDGRSPTDHTTDRPGRGRRRGSSTRDELVDHLEAENAWLRARVEFYERQVEHQAGEIAELRRGLPPPSVGGPPPTTPPATMPRTAPETAITRRKAPPWYIRLFRR